MKKKIICCCFGIAIILMVIFVLVLSTSKSKYDKKARKAAETCLENEIKSYTWTTVKTGKLKYMYTMYNEVLDKYNVSYYTKFNAADEIEDQWIFIEIVLSGKTLGISSYNVSFCDINCYEITIDSGLYKKTKRIENKDGQWIKVD